MARCTVVRVTPVRALNRRRLRRGLRRMATLSLRRTAGVRRWGRRVWADGCTLPVASNPSAHRVMVRAGGASRLPNSRTRARCALVAEPSSHRRWTARIHVFIGNAIVKPPAHLGNKSNLSPHQANSQSKDNRTGEKTPNSVYHIPGQPINPFAFTQFIEKSYSHIENGTLGTSRIFPLFERSIQQKQNTPFRSRIQ